MPYVSARCAPAAAPRLEWDAAPASSGYADRWLRVRPGIVRAGGADYRLHRAGQVGQDGEGFGLLAAVGMGVAVHRQRDGRVSRQRLRRLGVDAAGRQVADERVPQGVEVCHTAGIVPEGDARRF